MGRGRLELPCSGRLVLSEVCLPNSTTGPCPGRASNPQNCGSQPQAHQFYSRGGIGRRGSLKTSVSGVPRTRPDGDGSSLQNCDSGFNSSRVCHVGDAEVVEAAVRKTALTGFESRLSLHRRARSDGNAFWSRKPALREGPGWGFDSSALRHNIKVLAFCTWLTYSIVA